MYNPTCIPTCNPTRMRALAVGLAAAALAAAGALHLGAEEATTAGQPSAAAEAPPQLAEAQQAPAPASDLKIELPIEGMTVAIDPVTGRLRQPTPAEAKALADGLLQKFGRSGPLQVVHHRDGMLSAVVTSEYTDYTVVTVDGEGRAAMSCVDNADDVARLLVAGAAEEKKP